MRQFKIWETWDIIFKYVFDIINKLIISGDRVMKKCIGFGTLQDYFLFLCSRFSLVILEHEMQALALVWKKEVQSYISYIYVVFGYWSTRCYKHLDILMWRDYWPCFLWPCLFVMVVGSISFSNLTDLSWKMYFNNDRWILISLLHCTNECNIIFKYSQRVFNLWISILKLIRQYKKSWKWSEIERKALIVM